METIDKRTLEAVLRLACSAPSVHNTQPWRWRVDHGAVDLCVDHGSRLMATDPVGRDQTISCGAALHTLTVAAAAKGWVAGVERLPHPSVLAHVEFRRATTTPTDADRSLAQAAAQRRTDRRQVTSWPVPLERLNHLERIVNHHGALLMALVADIDSAGLFELLTEALRTQGRNGRYHDELLTWSEERDGLGVPAANRLSRLRPGRPAEGLSRFPAGALVDPGPDAEPAGGAWLILSTSSDDALSWLRAGEALQAAWLWSTTQGMSLVPHSAPIEVEAVRARIQRGYLRGASCPQLVLRIGWPPISQAPPPPTPRQALTTGG